MDVTKIIKAKIGHSNYVVAEPIMKEDYGLYLLIEGIDLPQSYEVDFSNELRDGTSVTMIGDENGVRIPEKFIEPGRNVYAFYYHVGADFGRTLYTIRIPNRARPERTDEQPTPAQESTIDQAIAALNVAVAKTAQDVISADQSAQSAGENADRAESARDAAEGYAQNASDSASAAATSASQASASASSAAQSASQSAQSASAASASASSAATSASTATTKAAEAEASAASVVEAAQTATAKAAEASASASTASTKASEAAQSASTASTKATEANTAKTAAETAQTAAEDAQEAAETAAQNIETSAAQIATNTADISDLKRDLNDKAPIVIETASGAIASFSDGTDDMPMKSLIVNIEPVQSGSGDPSPDNVRPISGWTGCEVNVTGINQWDEEWEVGEYHIDSGVKTGSAGVRSKNPIRIVGGAQYRLYAKTAAASNNIGFCFYDADGNYISGGVSSQAFGNVIVTAPQNARYLNFFVPNSWYGSTYNHDISINYPSTDHDYHESHAKSYPISWQSEAGTVYCGTLDVVSGLLTVDRKYIDMGSLSWSAGYTGFFTVNVGWTGDFICEMYPQVPYVSSTSQVDKTITWNSGSHALIAADSAYSDAASFKTAMSDVGLVTKLAQPQTYQLTPTEVKSVLGLNNVWADCGGVEVEYRADTKMFVESQIPDVPVDDVQINGTSVVNDGVANVPIADTSNLGVCLIDPTLGVSITNTGKLGITVATSAKIKEGTEARNALVPKKQHESVFYGLAKAAGDTTQSASSNAVGNYTESAKSEISEMLGGSVSVSGTTPTIVAKSGIRYVCGEVSTLDLTPPASGICDVVFTSGSTATVLTVPSTVKWANGFDPTALDADTTYEINIMDGLGVCCGWT